MSQGLSVTASLANLETSGISIEKNKPRTSFLEQ